MSPPPVISDLDTCQWICSVMPTTASAGTGATTTSTAAMPSTDAASTIMTNHHTVSVSTYCGVTYKVLRMVIEANCSHIFRGCGVLLRQYATRHHRLDQPGFNQGLRDT